MNGNERKAALYLEIFAIIFIASTVFAFVPSYGFIVGLVLSIVSFILIMLAFKLLSKSNQNFKLPFTFALIGTIGLIIILVVLFISYRGALFSTSIGSAIPNMIIYGIMLLILVVIGATLAFMGLIAGLILGLWKVGKKYHSRIISIGAVLLIIPILNIAGLILLIAGLLKLK